MTASEPASAPSTPAAASDAPAPETTAGKDKPRRGAGLSGLALVLALLALIAAAWGGWRVWRMQQGGLHDSRELKALTAQVQSLQSRLDAQAGTNRSMQQQVKTMQQQAQDLDDRMQSLAERSRNLENAVAGLSARARSGHDATRLDEAGLLLQMAGERFALFHDSDGALHAYAMADRLLAEVEDPAYAEVRKGIARERQALVDTHPGQRRSNLDTLSRLRAAVDTLPLKPDTAAPQTTARTFWARVKHAFSGLVQIRRDDAFTPTRRALARSLTALDLAQAQAALLAWDADGYHQALDRAAIRLEHDFDPQVAAVRDARAQIARLRAQAMPPVPQLGAALVELNNLRAVHDAAAPSPAASSAGGAHR